MPPHDHVAVRPSLPVRLRPPTAARRCAVAALTALMLTAGCGAGDDATSPAGVARTRIRVGYTSAVDIGDLPSLVAHRALQRRGYEVVPTFFARPELAVEALARGDIDVANGGARAFWAANARGADLLMLMEHSENGYLVVSSADIGRCEELTGRTLALSSSGALPTAIGRAFLNQCPGARPHELTMPHSGDRLSALLSRSVDAAVIQRADVARLESEAPGSFRVLGAPDNLAHLDLEGVFVSRSLIAEHRQLAVDYVRERVFANRQVLDNPDLLYEEAARWPNMGTLDERVVAGEVGAPAWAHDGGLSADSLDATIAFFVETGSLPASTQPETSADLSLLADALAAIAENGGAHLPDSR